jgi:bacterioferritin-associated ferredoxin
MLLRIILVCNTILIAMYICICNGVTEREIRGAADLGCSTLDDLSRDLGVATCCGKCAPEARRVLNSCARCPSRAACGGDD